MTIPNTARKAGPLLGTGSQTAWPFTFKVFAAGDVQVTIANSAGTETLLVLGTDYTVTLNSNQDTSPGGTVNYPISGAALPVGSVLAIIGDLDYDQPLDLPSGGNFSPLALENQLDRATMQIQQLKEEVDRSAKLPPTSAESVEALVDDLQRLADSADNLDTVADNIADITAVANDLNEPVSEINTVAGAIANVNAVGSNITNVNTVAGISANVTTVASIAANVTAVAAIDDDVTAVAGVSAAVTAVAAIDDDVTIAAANVADITNFADVYQGAKTSDPALRNDGSALQAGDLYFNTTNDEMRVYGGTLWKSGFVGTVAVQNFSGNGSTTAFTLTTAPGGENNTQIFIGGVYQQKDQYSVSGTTLTFSTAPTTGTNNIEVVTISTLALGETDAALVSFVQAGTGAVERTAQGKMRERVSVKDFGAVGDGSTDDTAAIQSAISSSTGNLAVYFPSGTYKVTSQITISSSRVMLYGDAAASKILFVPTANAVCFLFENGSSSSVQNVMRDLVFYSTDTTYTKTAIKLIDVSQCVIDNVQSQFPHWHGNTSIFLHVLGRDSTTVRNLNVFADRPIRISPIPAPHAASGIGIDHFHFSDCYLGNTTSANPLITIDDGVILSDVTFDGYQAWVGGSHGLYWNDTTSTAVSFGLTLANVRWEQPFSSGGWAVYINRTATGAAHQVNLRNLYLGLENGVYLRKTLYFVLDNIIYAGANTAANIDNSNSFGQINLVAPNNAATITLNALRQSGQFLSGGNTTILSASAPAGSGMAQRFNPSSTLGFSQLEPKTFTVANATNIAFSNNTLRGIVLIYSTVGPVSAVMAVNGSSNTTKLLSQSDAGWFGVAAGAANFNLYWDAGTSTYRLQNTLGSTSTFWVVTMGQGEKA